MQLYLNIAQPSLPISRSFLEKRIRKLLCHLNYSEAILGISMVSDRKIAQLNFQYLKRTGPTDVISFPMDSNELLGDIVISYPKAKKQAKEKKHSIKKEITLLLIHGLLHLLGYDHVQMKDFKKMKKKEAELLKLFYR